MQVLQLDHVLHTCELCSGSLSGSREGAVEPREYLSASNHQPWTDVSPIIRHLVVVVV